MPYNTLQEFITDLEQQGELVRITKKVDTALEITEIVDRVSKMPGGGKALLFENNGTNFPVLINALGSDKRMCMALGVKDYDEVSEEILKLFKKISAPRNSLLDKIKLLPDLGQIASWMPKSISGRGACQQVVMEKPDLSLLPVLKCWPFDGGPFITFPVVNTKDPLTGIRNAGMYRMQVLSADTTGMHWHRHKVGARHYNEYKKLNQKMPIAVCLGGDPLYTYCATAPLPDHIDEYILAGFLRKRRVELVKCLTNDIEVPNDADIVIEGYVDPSEELIWEGPFGDHTGFYSLADWYPRFHVTCITHRKGAIYPATIVGIPPQEDAYIAKATERIFLAPIKLTLAPEVVDIDIPQAGVAHNLTIVSIDKSYPGQAAKIANTLWGAGQMMFNKTLVVVDASVNVHDYESIGRLITQNCNPSTDIHFASGPMDVLDHSASRFAFGGKMCWDATSKLPEEIYDSVKTDLPTIKQEHIDKLMADHPEITAANFSQLSKGISVVVLGVKKGEKNLLKELHKNICQRELFQQIKFFVFADESIDINDLYTTAWVALNNCDPKRDCFVIEGSENQTSSICIDATVKSREKDGFKRDWPNAVISDQATITKVDQIWQELNLGPLVSSPSMLFSRMVLNDGAVAEQNN